MTICGIAKKARAGHLLAAWFAFGLGDSIFVTLDAERDNDWDADLLILPAEADTGCWYDTVRGEATTEVWCTGLICRPEVVCWLSACGAAWRSCRMR